MSIKDKSSILLDKETRILLSKLGRKEQTYDDVIRELLNSKKRLDSLENKKKIHQLLSDSSELVSPSK